MTKKTKIILTAVIAALLIAVLSLVVVFTAINSENKIAKELRTAFEERDEVSACLLISDFNEKERKPALEKIVTTEIEKVYKSEDYEGILFAEKLVAGLNLEGKSRKPVREFCEELKKIPEKYKNAREKAYMKGYWVREDGSIYKNMVVIVAGSPEGLAAKIRTVGTNYEGYQAGDPIWSSIVFTDGYKFSVDVLNRTKEVYFSYKKGFGTVDTYKGVITISVDGQIQNWRKADYEEIKEMSYDYRSYKGSKWVCKENSAVTLEIKESIGSKISFEVYDSEEDVRLIINNLSLYEGQADFDDGETTAGTIRLLGKTVNMTFTNDAFPSGDYVLQ